MTAEQWQNVKSLLGACLDQPRHRRAAWLAENAPSPEVHAEVASLLAASDEITDFLEQPAKAGTELVSAIRPDALIGERIGPYELVEEIGRGGMGTVYRATRADDEFQIDVAIKIVARGMDTDVLLRRFRTERQILARLDHPYIARLLDGGTTPGGLPYFVMEYVKGTPLTEYCDANSLAIPERLDLFAKVCQAVSYAHRSLVVHRDLKPANILVTEDGTPKLLDFGIARITSPTSADVTEPTVTMMRMATPAYASPEQIRGGIAGPSSDIYSLGVLLYELLTGHRPYRLPRRESGELARVICEREPTRASLVVGLTESIDRSDGSTRVIEPETICRRRSTTVDQLRRKLRGDLDNIVAMALRKEPHRRYESVEQFSRDLQRHAAGLPIVAHKDTLSYRTGKFIERHRIGVGAGVMVAAALIGTSVFALNRASKLAHRIQEDHRLASSFVVEIHDTIAKLPGSTPAREAVLRQSLQFLNGLARDAGEDPGYQRSLALAYEKLAELQIGVMGPGLGRSSDALQTGLRAHRIRVDIAQANASDLQAQYELANNELLLGYISGRSGLARRREYDRSALKIAESLIAAEPRDQRYRLLLARANVNNAYGLLYEDKWSEAQAFLRNALAIHAEILAENPGDKPARRSVANIRYRLGAGFVQAGQPLPARDHLGQALEIQQRLSAAEPHSAGLRSEVASTHHFLGMAFRNLDDHERSLRHLQHAIDIRRAALAADPRDERSRSMLAGNYAEQSATLLAVARKKEAIAAARTAVELQAVVWKSDPQGAPTRISLAEYQAKLGRAYLAGGKPKDAVRHLRFATDLYAELEAEGYLTSPAIRADAQRAAAELAEAQGVR